MKFIKKNPKKEPVWVPCPDFKPWTVKEKIRTFINTPVFIPVFLNCQHCFDCECYTSKNPFVPGTQDCRAGEYVNEDN